jgi:predicted patatin/cPLA2 family phospholipase
MSLENRQTKNNDQCIISSKKNNIYCNSEADLYIKANNFLMNKKLITISPGGFKGFYLLGVLTFIKENYNLDNYIFSGASAGSWNSLFMCYKGDTLSFVYNLLDYNIKKARSISELQYFIKYKLLSTYNETDFDLERLFIGVTTFHKWKPNTNIFSDFNDLNDAINCCIASSHIPFITGGLTNRYHNMFSFDGGFSSFPYLQKENSVLHVSHTMWESFENNSKNSKNDKHRNIKCIINSLKHYSDFFSISKNNLLELFDNGYNDAIKNQKYLDEIFIERKEVTNQIENNEKNNTNNNSEDENSNIEF